MALVSRAHQESPGLRLMDAADTCALHSGTKRPQGIQLGGRGSAPPTQDSCIAGHVFTSPISQENWDEILPVAAASSSPGFLENCTHTLPPKLTTCNPGCLHP